MTQSQIGRDSLVLFKGKPAIIARTGQKLELLLQDGETVSVRPKDVALLHRGPASFAALKPPPGDMEAAWELLASVDGTTTLDELAELAYGEDTPAAALAAWEWVADGAYFSGTPDDVTVHSAEQVERTEAARAARAAEALAWSQFLERARNKQTNEQDTRYLDEVEEVAYGQRARSRVLDDLDHAQTPESAHAFLLDVGYWDEMVNPHPRRLNMPATDPTVSFPPLPDEPRLDLTHLPAFAIDDAGNQDPDDALSVDGDRIWVHVADVAALIQPDSPADLEARARGATLYLPETTIAMLPRAATEQLGLGLQPVSPALSFGMRVGEDGSLNDLEIAPSWVRVSRLSYEEAEGRLDEEPLASLYRATNRFSERRRRGGSINLDLPETKMRVIGGRVEITPLASLRSRDTVAEAMMMVGAAVAQFALDHDLPIPFAFQEAPEPLDVPDTLAGMFARRKTMRPSRQAIEPARHSGLGLDAYVRATSPLRRYLDLVTHQQLRAYLLGRPLLAHQAVIERIGASDAVTGSVRQAESLSRQHWLLVYFLQHKPWRGEGVVVDRFGSRAVVVVPELAWESRVHVREDVEIDSTVRLSVTGVDLPTLDAFVQAMV
ncbi:MAG: RNB domain-containing ribonuclease [Anaerolineae bacterium]|nr:RNB domain-containing ribonuclease [Anaerolineae bacterium]